MDIERRDAARHWNAPLEVVKIEHQRKFAQRALAKIIGGAVSSYVPEGANILEVGAGTGFLKDLIPPSLHEHYISSDYNVDNLLAGTPARRLTAVAASAYELPFADGSMDAVVSMDAYDTMPDLDTAIGEAKRVLTPGGHFIVYQVNFPSDDLVWRDYPGTTFFPPLVDEKNRCKEMKGVNTVELEKVVEKIGEPSIQRLLQYVIDDPSGAFTLIRSEKGANDLVTLFYKILGMFNVPQIVIPSVPEYYHVKMKSLVLANGFELVTSGFESGVFLGSRNEAQRRIMDANEFELGFGGGVAKANKHFKSRGDLVREKATAMVLVARK